MCFHSEDVSLHSRFDDEPGPTECVVPVGGGHYVPELERCSQISGALVISWSSSDILTAVKPST